MIVKYKQFPHNGVYITQHVHVRL